MTDITIKGLEQLRANLTSFSDRRFNAAVATALSRTAVQTRDKMRMEMGRVLDRPTPYTLNSLYTVPATAEKLNATVRFKDTKSAAGGTPSAYYMLPQVEGGRRRYKAFESMLSAMGALPQGMFIVPAAGAMMDAYGNVSRSQITAIVTQFKAQGLTGPVRSQGARGAAVRRAGGQFFVMKAGGNAAPGIYQRETLGRNITPVFLFVRTVTYRRRLAFYDAGQRFINETLGVELERSVREHIARLAVKK